MPQAVKSPALKPGDSIYYPPDGVGEVVSTEETQVLGQSIETYVIRFDRARMTNRIPVAKIPDNGLKMIGEFATEAKVQKTLKIICARRKVGRGMWSRRATELESKIISSNLVDLAEVIRDINRNEDEESELSYSEREQLKKVSQRLLDILTIIWDIPEEEVKEKVNDLLTKAGKRTLSFTF